MPRPPRPVPRFWIDIVHGAHDAGDLVYSIDQGNLIRLSHVPDAELVEGGVCFALCSHWLGLRALGRDLDQFFQASRGFHHVTEVPEKVFTEQLDRYFDRELWTGELSPGRLRGSAVNRMTQVLVLAKAGLKVVASRRWAHGASTAAFPPLQELLESQDALVLVGLYGPGGAHAIALQNHAPDGTYRLFDPNFGHFRFRGFHAVRRFLTRLFTATPYGGRYTGSGYGYLAVPLGRGPKRGLPAGPIPLGHPRLNTTYASPPPSRPVAVLHEPPELPFRMAFRRAVNRHAGVAQSSGLRAFVLSPTNDDTFRTVVNLALSDATMFLGKGLKVWCTPLVGSRYPRLETRIHYF